MSMLRWWAVVVVGAAAALLFAWLGRLAGVPAPALLAVGAGVAALMWAVVLVTLPWTLYFDARQVLRRNATARERGIAVPPGSDGEAELIARRALRVAIAGHLGTAAATAVFAWATGSLAGYYLSAFYLFSTAVRPAAAFLVHLRERIGVLRREGSFPPDDVAALKHRVEALATGVEALRESARRAGTDLAADLAHLGREHARLESGQATDRADCRARDERTRERIDQMARRVEATLDGIGDHQELLTGIRALVRMIRTEPA